MLKVTNVHSVTDFARNTRDHIERLQGSGEPEVLTINGKAAVVVQDAEAYQRLVDLADYVDTVRTLRERLESFAKRGRGRPMRKAIEELAAEAGIDLECH
jgi:PHD/YefM family antitoxin component YafN of YafNO toxin-antitoxin module